MKPELIDTCESSFAIQTQKFKLFNYDIYRKCVSDYILGLIILKNRHYYYIYNLEKWVYTIGFIYSDKTNYILI